MNFPHYPPSDILFYPFYNGGILYLNGSRKIWILNSIAAFVWCILDKVNSIEEIATNLVTAFQIENKKALKDAQTTLDCFKREGLFGIGHQIELPEKNLMGYITQTGPKIFKPSGSIVKRFYQAGNHVFQISSENNGLFKTFCKYIDHLKIEAATPCHTKITILSGKGGINTWDIFIDRNCFKENLRGNEVFPHLVNLFFIQSCKSLKDKLLFHAAVIEKDGAVILMPAESGCGKTTLAAALTSHNWHYFSDEIAALEKKNLCVSPLPLPMSIKLGSIGPLSNYFPELKELPSYQREDGKIVRYILPPSQNLPKNLKVSFPVNYLVFPKFNNASPTRLYSIDKYEGMKRLTKTGSSNRDFTKSDLEAMISLIEKSPCFELVYSDLNEAIFLLENKVNPNLLGYHLYKK